MSIEEPRTWTWSRSHLRDGLTPGFDRIVWTYLEDEVVSVDRYFRLVDKPSFTKINSMVLTPSLWNPILHVSRFAMYHNITDMICTIGPHYHRVYGPLLYVDDSISQEDDYQSIFAPCNEWNVVLSNVTSSTGKYKNKAQLLMDGG